jgi:hypothetical protein
VNAVTEIAYLVIERQLNLNRLSGGYQNEIAALFQELAQDIERKVGVRPLTEFSKERLSRLINDIRTEVADVFDEQRDAVKAELLELASDESRWALSTINTVIEADIARVLAPQAVLRQLVREDLFQGAPLDEWFKRQSADTQFAVTSAIRIGVAQGETNGQIVRRLATQARQGNDGVLDIKRRNLDTLVRTAVQTVANNARNSTWSENDDIIKSLQQLSTLDGRTSDICMAYSGKQWTLEDKQPIGHNLPWNSGTPRHWNAVAGGQLVSTSGGQVPIELVRVGDLVITHRGRFKPVTAVMRKRNESGVIRTINLESGRAIRVTDEHPVLASGRGWVRADMLEAGDELFQYQNEPVPISVWLGIAERNPNNYPSVFDAAEVFSDVSFVPGAMASTIKLNDDLCALQCEVSDAVENNELSGVINSMPVKNDTELNFTERQFGKLISLGVLNNSFNSAIKSAWVGFLHSLGVFRVMVVGFFGVPPRPMILPAQPTGFVGNFDSSNCSISSASHFNSVTLTPKIKRCFCEALLSLNGSNGFSFLKMLFGYKRIDGLAASEVNHFICDKISDIGIVGYDEDVFNIAVEEDETYLVDGVVVHNCRSVTIPVLKSFAEMGIDLPELSPSTRASMDGQVAAGFTFEEFLEKKGKAFQDRQLGPGRAQLWREGKITLTQLLDQRGNALTLAELQRLYD